MTDDDDDDAQALEARRDALTRLRHRLVERLRACDAKVEGGDREGWSSLLPTTKPREEETEEVEDDAAAVREETMRTESAGYDVYGDDAEDVPVRSLSPRAEYEAALAVVSAPASAIRENFMVDNRKGV